jgi:hypothetical protein
MSDKITVYQKETRTVELDDETAKAVVKEYITKKVLEDGCYVTREGKLEHWTSWPHGSGTTTDMGVPSPLQAAAWRFLELLAN